MAKSILWFEQRENYLCKITSHSRTRSKHKKRLHRIITPTYEVCFIGVKREQEKRTLFLRLQSLLGIDNILCLDITSINFKDSSSIFLGTDFIG